VSNSGPCHITLPPHKFLSIVQSACDKDHGYRVRGRRGMSLWAVWHKIVAILTERRYRPELHYMRGPGPKWLERHGRP